MNDEKQIRFCPECGYQERDDDFEINKARCNDDEGVDCPKCKTWLWSVIFDHNDVEILDWDENSIHDTEDALKKLLLRAIDVINGSQNMGLEQFKNSLEEAPVVKKGEYPYIIHPITDGVPYIKPDLLEEVTCEMQKLIEKCGQIDKIVTIEAMGIPLATALSLRTGIPFTIIRKRKYGLPGEVSVEQKTGYSESKLYINGLSKGDKIIIVDDMLSTGGTLRAVLTGLDQIGTIVKGIFIAVDKSNKHEFPIMALVGIKVVDGKVVIRNRNSGEMI